jgi:hypothetical protein
LVRTVYGAKSALRPCRHKPARAPFAPATAHSVTKSKGCMRLFRLQRFLQLPYAEATLPSGLFPQEKATLCDLGNCHNNTETALEGTGPDALLMAARPISRKRFLKVWGPKPAISTGRIERRALRSGMRHRKTQPTRRGARAHPWRTQKEWAPDPKSRAQVQETTQCTLRKRLSLPESQTCFRIRPPKDLFRCPRSSLRCW